MNSVFAYFDMSYNTKILHLNDSNEFENEINKQLEKKIEPMEPTLETIFGQWWESTLNQNWINFKWKKERKDLQELHMEFQKVFAWSYEDMPGINPEIAQYHIDTHDLIVPVKQKLRRMRIEWLLNQRGSH